MMPSRSLLAVALLLAGAAEAQVDTTPQQGLAEKPSRHYAIVGAAIMVAPGKRIEDGTLEVRDGVVVAARAGRRVPAGALVIEAEGKTIWPAFIDVHGSYGFDTSARCRQPAGGGGNRGGGRMARMGFGAGAPAASPEAAGAQHWNDRVCPEREVAAALALDGERAKTLRRIGFGASVATPGSGVLRGQSALLSLRSDPTTNAALLAAGVGQHAAFEADFSFGGVYPGSKMGAIALIRQSLLDADWLADMRAWHARNGGERPEANAALDALSPVLVGEQPLVFAADDELDTVRAARIASEFGLKKAWVLGTGAEYRVLDQLPANVGLIVPLNFPEAPKVEDAEAALDLNLADLEHWRLAPHNPNRIAAAGREFALTLARLDKPEDAFWPALRKAVRYGLSEEAALAALTTTPARWLGQQQRLGSLEAGRIASFVIADDTLLRDDSARIYEVHVDGQRDIVRRMDEPEVAGRWQLAWVGAQGPAEWTLSGQPGSLEVKVGEDKGSAKLEGGRLTLNLPAKLVGGAEDERALLEAALSKDRLDGRWLLADGRVRTWSATRLGDAEPEKPADDKKENGKEGEKADKESVAKAPKAPPAFPAQPGYPAGEYARMGLPPQQTVLVRGATVWMSGGSEPLAASDVLIEKGKIKAVGQGLRAPAGAIEIDGAGLHVTPGLIDAHSHTALAAQRQRAQPCGHLRGAHRRRARSHRHQHLSPAGRRRDHQLAAARLGQSDRRPERGDQAALGRRCRGAALRGRAARHQVRARRERQAVELGRELPSRYPQTRMGVEQLLIDAFRAGRRLRQGARAQECPPLRRDLRLEALAEILAKERFVHIHSYRQDEILMYARLSASLGVPVAAFQHVLEGFKVADALAETGAGASTFSDWWGFKMETYDAIPYNAAMMVRQGVLTSVNSDSNDLGRRMNTEAAKAVKYGGLTDTEALALVTINPAKQLRVESRVGTIEPGKDADIVLWSHHPLSSYARPQRVWIDGREYFDIAADRAEQQRIAEKRAELVQAVLAEAPKGGGAAPGGPRRPRMLIDPTRYRVLDSGLAALRSPYHNGEAVHYCQGGH
jgi:imidazolonepropionase-like amidohydrolase